MATSNSTQSKLITDKDTFISYYYRITEFYIITNGIPDPLPVERIVGISIENNFDSSLFPLFKVSVVLERSRYFNLINNKNVVEFKLRLQRFYRKRDIPSDESIPTDCISDVFIMYNDENSPDMKRPQLEPNKNGKIDTDINKLEKLENIVDLFLFSKRTAVFQKEFSTVYQNTNLSTAITRMLQVCGASKVLMSPLENTASYPQIIIPPMKIGKILKYFNNNYGLYQCGAQIFFGLFHSYILNYKGEPTAYVLNEWLDTVIFVLNAHNTMGEISGCIMKQKEKINYYVANSSAVEDMDNNQSENAINGVNPTLISPTGSGGGGANVSGTTVRDVTNRVVFNRASNPFLTGALAAQQFGDGHTLSVALENVNIENFNPNKRFSFVFEDPLLNERYHGKYKISSANYIFNKDGDSASLSALLIFKKALV